MTDADFPLPPIVAPSDARLLLVETFERPQVTQLRHMVAAAATTAGVTGQRLEDFVLAVNELITNAVRHGGGQGWLRLWREADSVVCEVSDTGHGMGVERLTNRERPAANTAGGWGLWLAGQVTDSMVMESGPAGTTVRISTAITRTEPAAVERVE
ncbi:ATP-binding protein [Micromonospora sp. NPDC049679]|uniref:ATP-binding protein n=1 Tax=Micromonospora sp. NPDC049679 TaxID=3155920 RepID=UPI0033EF5468